MICTRDIGGNERYQLFLVSSDGADVRRITKNLDAMHHFGAWSPNGEQIAFTSNERNGLPFDVYIHDISRGDPKIVFQTDGNYRVLTWSPDGKQLILCHEISSAQRPLYLLDVETGTTRPLTPLDQPIDNHHACGTADGPVFVLTN